MVRKKLLLSALLGALLVGSAGKAGASINLGGTLGTVIKVFGIGYAVRVFGPQINSFINTVLMQRGLSFQGATKVVPILSLGQGVHIGAAQVMGAPSRVTEVKAVGQGELRVSNIRLNGLFPVSTTLPIGETPRVISGVGISAIIDFHV